MNWRRLAIAAGVGVGLASLASASSASGPEPRQVFYPVHPNGPGGPVWGSRPPGLPASARPCSIEGAAANAIMQAANAEGLGADFAAFLLQLAEGESGQCFGRPANNFDARLQAGYSRREAYARRLVPDVNTARPAGRKLITAWGVFQFNRDAWRYVLQRLGVDPGVALPFPWECTPAQEIGAPARWYAQLWRDLAARRLSAAQIAAMIRVWHWSPAAYDQARGLLGGGFDRAWATVPRERRDTIAAHVRDARIGTIA